jgi:hypothetical protein
MIRDAAGRRALPRSAPPDPAAVPDEDRRP